LSDNFSHLNGAIKTHFNQKSFRYHYEFELFEIPQPSEEKHQSVFEMFRKKRYLVDVQPAVPLVILLERITSISYQGLHSIMCNTIISI
jgi:hypothetical protein